MNFGGAYSSLFVGVFSTTSVFVASTASSILGEPEPHRPLRGFVVGLLLLLVDLPRYARAVHPPAGRANCATNALVQLGNAIIDTAASGSSSGLVVRHIVGGDLHVYRCLHCRSLSSTSGAANRGRHDVTPRSRTQLQTLETSLKLRRTSQATKGCTKQGQVRSPCIVWAMHSSLQASTPGSVPTSSTDTHQGGCLGDPCPLLWLLLPC